MVYRSSLHKVHFRHLNDIELLINLYDIINKNRKLGRGKLIVWRDYTWPRYSINYILRYG